MFGGRVRGEVAHDADRATESETRWSEGTLAEAASALRERVDGEVRFDAGHASGVLDRRLELPAGADRGRRAPHASRPRSRRSRCAASTARRSCPAAAARAWPVSAPTRRSSSTGPSTATGWCRSTPSGARAWWSRASCSTSSTGELGADRAAVRARAGHPPELHARRDDRQQLLRRHRPAHGQGGRQHRLAWRCCCYDGTRFRSAQTTDDEYAEIERRGDRRGAGLPRSCAGCARSTATRSGQRYPDIPRRVSGYNLDSLLPEHGFDVAGVPGRQRVDPGDRAAGRARAGAGGQGAAPWWCSASRTSRRRRRRPGDRASTSRSPWRASTTSWSATSGSRA